MEKYNFITIFQTANINKIVIPIIQRDYAQGRNNSAVKRVRETFLNALLGSVTDKPITLDFIYGDLDGNGTLIPLDGQQRLTTLFLLHWYAARRENISAEFLHKFSYETRPDAQDFCADLVKFTPQFDKESLSKEIEDQAWFPLSWKKDPTISAMLTMLDAIGKKFSGIKNLWRALENNAVTFYFMPIKDMGLTDEIYITMNSRGKLLTEFEHFKAEFKRRLDEIDSRLSEKIIRKIDIDWTDLLWKYRDENNLVDNGFLNYFRFICDILLYRDGKTPLGRERDAFSLLDEFFSGNVRGNVQFMQEAFNCWCQIDVDKFFADRVLRGWKNENPAHQSGKFVARFPNSNFFESCVRSEKFSLGQTLMLYAFVVYRMNKIDDADFRRRIRIVNNLVSNSGDAELSKSESRNNGNRISAMIEQVDSIIIHGKILTGEQIQTTNRFNFNENQLTEERKKLKWTAANPEQAEELFALEDHYLLYGQISVVGLENPQNFSRFLSLFECDYDLIDCALLSLFDYFQHKKQLYQFGAKIQSSWQNLFHLSEQNKGFEDTQLALDTLLSMEENFTNERLAKIVAEHLEDCERRKYFEWSYYYIKYAEFRPSLYGKYSWADFERAPYLFEAYRSEKRWSEKAYQPFLRAVVDEEIFNAHYNSANLRLEFDRYFVECENAAYVVKDSATNREIVRLEINQRGGVDTEDRILKFKDFIATRSDLI